MHIPWALPRGCLSTLSSEFLAPLLLDLPAAGQACRWVVGNNIECGATLPTNRRIAAAHLRKVHGISVGDASGMVSCGWYGCHVPMRRRSMIRHVLEVHLRLMRWDCLVCGKTLTRRAKHRCLNGGNMTVQDNNVASS
ncbi:hypothetical protein OG21DRAFT_961168 [Imleria badia]|nr:hypothetical protein OG21DRAFT_961168 [Imleria badia]